MNKTIKRALKFSKRGDYYYVRDMVSNEEIFPNGLYWTDFGQLFGPSFYTKTNKPFYVNITHERAGGIVFDRITDPDFPIFAQGIPNDYWKVGRILVFTGKTRGMILIPGIIQKGRTPMKSNDNTAGHESHIWINVFDERKWKIIDRKDLIERLYTIMREK